MKNTGITRKVDDLGRIVVPKELRKIMNMRPENSFEIYYEPNEEKIVLKEFTRGCVLCKEMENTIEFKGELICKECLKELKGSEKRKGA